MQKAARLPLAFLPIAGWLHKYSWRQWLRLDVVAGITLWGVVVPEGIAYAGLAGMPPQAGLYTLIAAMTAYAIFGTSKQLVVVATSASAVMLASIVAALNPPNPSVYLALAGGLVLIVGVLFILSGIIKLGFITNFISRPVMDGFIIGLAIFVVVKQLPKLLGIERGGGNTFEQLFHLFGHLGDTQLPTLAVSAVALVLLFGLHRVSRRFPAGLVVLVLGILVSAWFQLSSAGVQVVGAIPAGLPSIGLPEVRLQDLWVLLPSALGMMLVIFSEGLGAADVFASKHKYEIDPNQELIAYGVANLGSGLLGGLVAGGSLSQSSVNDSAGAKSALSLLVAAALGLITVVALTPLFAVLPEAVLAGIIIHAVSHLMKVQKLKRIYRLQKVEFGLGVLALLGVLTLDVLSGLAIAVLCSLVYFIYRASLPHVSILGQVPGVAGAYGDVQRHSEDKKISGLIIFRLTEPLFFANAPLFRSRLRELVKQSSPPPKGLILDMSASDNLDVTSVEMLDDLVEELQAEEIEVMAVEVHQPVREIALLSGLAKRFTPSMIFPTIDSAVQDFLHRNPDGG